MKNAEVRCEKAEDFLEMLKTMLRQNLLWYIHLILMFGFPEKKAMYPNFDNFVLENTGDGNSKPRKLEEVLPWLSIGQLHKYTTPLCQ